VISTVLALAMLLAQPQPSPPGARPEPEYREPGCELVLCGRRITRAELIPVLALVQLDHEQGSLWRGNAAPGAQLIFEGKTVPIAPDEAFVIGFDRDQAPQARLVARAPGGSVRENVLRVTPRRWPLERVNITRRLPQPGDEAWRRREAEVLRMEAARTRPTGSQGWRQDFIWPAQGRISGRFGSQRIYRGEPGSYHGGVDVAAGAGAPVVAPADGVVVLAAGGFSLEGNLVILDHGHGLNSTFIHLSRIDVREGQAVRQGERIGAIGATGRATGPHLHWGLTWNGARLDPERVAGRMK
jgi:murein DD-endopeptidase MepM/ murein hydrolase activator NlpD